MQTLYSICFGLFSNEWNTQKATLPASWPLRCAQQRPCRRAPARLHTAPQQDLPSHLAFRKWAPRAPSAPPLCHLHSGLCHQGGPAGARRSTLNCAHGVFTHPASSDRHLPASDRELLTCLLGVWACSSSSAPRGAGPLLPGHCPAALPGGSWVWRPGSVRAPFSTLVKLP